MEWKEVKMKDFCYNVADGTHDSPKRQNEGRYLITSKHIKGSSIDYENAYKISEEDYQKIIKRSRVDRWDVIISMIGAYCGFCYLEDSEVTEYAVKNVGLLKVGKKYESQWLYYFLNSPEGKSKLFSCRAGSTQPYISLGTLRELSIKVPKEHHDLVSIVSILSSLDRKIELNNKINAQLEEMAQTLFKHWFVDFGPFKDGKFVESELGMIPEGWRVGTLDEVADIIMGQSPSGNDLNEQGEGLIFYQGCSDFTFRYPSIRVFTTAPTRLAEANSVLFSVRAPVGAINLAKEKCCIGRGIASIRSNNNCDSFVYYLLLSLKYLFDNYNGEGTVFGSINRKTLEGVKIVIPSEDIIIEINQKLASIDSRIKSLCEENQKLAVLRDTLLPKLMSGEINIEDYE